MQTPVALGLISSLQFVGTSSGEVYVGTDRLAGRVTASPQGGGGDAFYFPVDFTLSIEVDIVPFQSLTITDLTLTADPVAHDFPDFNGNLTLTIDELSLHFWDREFDLNPASGGAFKTPNIFGYMTGGTVDLKEQWDNYAFHEDLASTQNAATYQSSTRDIKVDPANYPEQ